MFVSLVFLILFGYKGKWGNFWIFYLVVFAITFISTFWVGPNNSTYEAAKWLPIFFVSLITGAALASLTMPVRKSEKWHTHRSEQTTIVADRKNGDLQYYYDGDFINHSLYRDVVKF